MNNNPTPREIVTELDKYIVGQQQAKKCVAIALRNRYRRSCLTEELREEVIPKNILMIGPTGVGKTEIARRLARLVNAPFVKVEATKFTEVGYVGRDVESMVRDLIEVAVRMVKEEKIRVVEEKAVLLADKAILNLLVPRKSASKSSRTPFDVIFGNVQPEEPEAQDLSQEQEWQEKYLSMEEKLKSGALDEEYVEIEVEDNASPHLNIFTGSNMEDLGLNFQDLFENIMPKTKKKKMVTVHQARKILTQSEAQKLIDMDEVTSEAIKCAEENGIIFLDEIDKIASQENTTGADVSRGGVQRDILPIVEGSTVMTKYGPVKTDHMLFIAAGAFHTSKPSDLIPELQGRFPIRVELESLSQEDFCKILTQPRNSLIRQYTELLRIEKINIEFTENAIDEIADIAYTVNDRTENIGARRLHTILEKLLEDILFNAPDVAEKNITIDENYVRRQLQDIVKDEDLSRYIL